MKTHWTGEQGITLVITLLVMTLLLVMGSAFMSISSTETLIAINERNRVQAFHLAEAGVEWAIAKLNDTGAYPGTLGEQSLGVGTYTTTVTDLTPPPPGVVDPKHITSTGFVPNGGVPFKAKAQVEVSVQRGSPFQFALFGMTNTELDGTEVDSYDSSQGLYNPATASAEGHIHSNNNVTIRSNNTVNGNVQAVNDIDILGAGNAITGTSTPGVPSITVVTNITPPPPTVDTTGISPPGAYNIVSHNLVVDPGVTLTLNPGTYSFNEIQLGQGAKLDMTGRVLIYMTGKFYAEGGNIINTSKIPANLMIFSSSDGTDGSGTDALKMDAGAAGAGEFYGAIYALNGEVEFQNAAPGWQIYGAIVAKHIDLEVGARFHYDVALANVRSPAGKFRPTATTWREIFP